VRVSQASGSAFGEAVLPTQDSAPSRDSADAICRILQNDLNDVDAWHKLEALLRDADPVAQDPVWRTAHTLFREVVWRDIRAFWRAGVDPKPYLMYTAKPLYEDGGLSFDAMGMRATFGKQTKLSYDGFLRTTRRRGLIIGNSTAAGVGVRSDGDTLASKLNQLTPDVLWYNLAIGGHNLIQNALALDLLAPEKFDYVVLCGGLIDFLAPLTLDRGTSFLPAYIPPHQAADLPTQFDIDKNGWTVEGVLKSNRRALESIAARVSRSGSKALFMLQPHLGMTSKQLCVQERCMVGVYHNTATQPIWIAHTKISDYAQTISDSYAEMAAHLSLSYIDANAQPSMVSSAWLYLDFIHVNELGHLRMAEMVLSWVQKAN